MRIRFDLILGCVLATFAGSRAVAAEYNPVAREPVSAAPAQSLQVIVKLRKSGAVAESTKLDSGPDRIRLLAQRTGLAMSLRREISETLLANSLDLRDATAEQALATLRADAAVEFVTRDERRFPHATSPNDSLFNGQWYLKNTEVAAVNAIDAWDLERGSTGIVVAVLDTGVLYDHPDLGRGDRGGRLLPGYDFVTASHVANDGDGRDANPSDPGDWISSADKLDSNYTNCDVASSSWHGTRVAGMIGALTNNSTGVAGISWNSFILPVRVLGKCGGLDSDILAGMRWAAGLSVPGVPANPTPARVLNASFGSTGPCHAAYRDVIDELTSRKVLLVISAGNEGTRVSSPADCPGVAGVAAIRHAGSKVGFSNLGPEVTLAAPGGNCVNVNGGPCLFSLDTTSNDGVQKPANHMFTDQVTSNLGTSFSAPIVSGIAALMLARNANLSTEQMLARLREGTRPFPDSVPGEPSLTACHVPVSTNDVQLEQCLCTTTTCGAGMADAAAAVNAADRPIAAVALPVTVVAGQDASFDAGGSTASCGRTVARYEWTVLSPATNPPALLGADTRTVTVLAPTSGSVTLRLTVADNLGRMDTAEVVVGTDSASTSAPASAGTAACASPITSGSTPTQGNSSSSSSSSGGSSSSSSGGGGGGAFDLLTVLLLGGLARVSRRHPI